MGELTSKAKSGFKWTTIERISLQVVSFVTGIIVARMVSPSDYGLIGMMTIFISLGNVILDSGFGTALIRKEERSEEDLSTAFYFNTAASIVVYLIIFACAPFLASFYETDILCVLIRVYGLILLINSLTVVQTAKLTAELCFKSQFFANFIAIFVSGVLGIFAAYKGLGVWALVIQYLSNAIIRTVLIWTASKWVPKMVFSKQSFKYLFGFGSKMLVTSMIDSIYDNLYNITIGKYYSSAQVGYYTRSQQIVRVPQDTLTQVVTKVSLPLLAPYQNDNKQLLTAYEQIFGISMFFLYPLLALMIALAQPTILFLLGEKWITCSFYMQILSVGAIWIPLTLLNLNLIIVKGRSDIILRIDVWKKIIGVAIIAITLPLGMTWVCFGTTIYALIAFIINSHQTQKLLEYGLWKQLKVIAPTLFFSIVTGILVYLIIIPLSQQWLKLLIGGLFGFLVYFLLNFLFNRRMLNLIICTIKHEEK